MHPKRVVLVTASSASAGSAEEAALLRAYLQPLEFAQGFSGEEVRLTLFFSMPAACAPMLCCGKLHVDEMLSLQSVEVWDSQRQSNFLLLA